MNEIKFTAADHEVARKRVEERLADLPRKLDLERAREFYRAALHWQKQPCHESTAAEDYKLGAALEDANTLPALLDELEAARAVVAAAERALLAAAHAERPMLLCIEAAEKSGPGSFEQAARGSLNQMVRGNGALRAALAAYRKATS